VDRKQSDRQDRDGAEAAPEEREDPRQRMLERRRLIQRKQDGAARAGGARVPETNGRPLSPEVRARMEPRVGGDLSRVQVHTDGASAEAARDLGAQAFTDGEHVHFGEGRFAPGTRDGDRLLAHELTHVADGARGVHRAPDPAQAQAGAQSGAHDVSQPGDPAEQKAEQTADRVTGELHDGKPPAASKNPNGDKLAKIISVVENKSIADATKIKDELLVGAGETLGLAELLGLRYPVKSYEAQVSSELYRGSRVDAKGMAGLYAQGIRGIVSFCMENDDDAAPAAAIGLHALRIPILDNAAPSEAQVRQFIQFVKNGQNQPVYCHCEAGKGRTGTMVACYRIAADGWSAQQAIAEGKTYGLQLANQIKFIETFAADVADGKFAV